MARWMVATLVTALTFGGIGRAGEDATPRKETDLAPGIELIRLGTIGDLPSRKRRLVLNVDAEGRLLVEGRTLVFSALRRLLLERASASRKSGPDWRIVLFTAR